MKPIIPGLSIVTPRIQYLRRTFHQVSNLKILDTPLKKQKGRIKIYKPTLQAPKDPIRKKKKRERPIKLYNPTLRTPGDTIRFYRASNKKKNELRGRGTPVFEESGPRRRLTVPSQRPIARVIALSGLDTPPPIFENFSLRTRVTQPSTRPTDQKEIVQLGNLDKKGNCRLKTFT